MRIRIIKDINLAKYEVTKTGEKYITSSENLGTRAKRRYEVISDDLANRLIELGVAEEVKPNLKSLSIKELKSENLIYAIPGGNGILINESIKNEIEQLNREYRNIDEFIEKSQSEYRDNLYKYKQIITQILFNNLKYIEIIKFVFEKMRLENGGIKYVGVYYFTETTKREKSEKLELLINRLVGIILNCEPRRPHVILKVQCEGQATRWCEQQLSKYNE